MRKNNLKDDLNDFISGPSVQMPTTLEQNIRTRIHQRLNPTWHSIFFKLALIQLIISPALFVICPQFNLGFYPHSFLGKIFMSWGETACNLSCGALFLGSGAIVSGFFLKHDELRTLRKNRFISLTGLAFLTLTLFVLFGVKIQLFMFLVWGVGAISTAMVSLELIWKTRAIT